MRRKFKIGDKVRILIEQHPLYGKIRKIVGIYEGNSSTVEFWDKFVRKDRSAYDIGYYECENTYARNLLMAHELELVGTNRKTKKVNRSA